MKVKFNEREELVVSAESVTDSMAMRFWFERNEEYKTLLDRIIFETGVPRPDEAGE